MSAHGSRFSGGYQFPRTDAATYTRQPVMLEETHAGATLRIVPLTGNGRTRFEVHAEWVEVKDVAGQVGPTTVLWPWYVDGPYEDALGVFEELARGFDAGEFPAGLP